MVGTLRKNKPEIPPSFTRFVPSMTSRFVYSNNATLVSYCPKKNKVVMLLSSLHKNWKIDESTGKPEIVMFYNSTKGGTDTFDQLCKSYTTARITNRWPMRFLYDMLDRAGINAFILFFLRHKSARMNRLSKRTCTIFS